MIKFIKKLFYRKPLYLGIPLRKRLLVAYLCNFNKTKQTPADPKLGGRRKDGINV